MFRINEVILRFPTIAEKLFKEIDNEGLTKCKEVSKLWWNFINDQKDLWLRIIRLQYEGYSQLWKVEGKMLKNKKLTETLGLLQKQPICSSF